MSPVSLALSQKPSPRILEAKGPVVGPGMVAGGELVVGRVAGEGRAGGSEEKQEDWGGRMGLMAGRAKWKEGLVGNSRIRVIGSGGTFQVVTSSKSAIISLSSRRHSSPSWLMLDSE